MFVEQGVNPAGSHVAQRVENETAEVGARVRQDRVRRAADLTVDVDDVEVQGARGVRDCAQAAGIVFDLLQRSKQAVRRHRALQTQNPVHVARLAGSRYRRAGVPAGACRTREPLQTGDGPQGAVAGLRRARTIWREKVRTKSDDDKNAKTSLRCSNVRPYAIKPRPATIQPVPWAY